MGENPYNEVTGAEEIDAVKGIADALKKVNAMSAEKESEGMGEDILCKWKQKECWSINTCIR